MDVSCSRCSLVTVAEIHDDAPVPPDGLGLCGPCGEIVNAERVAAQVSLMQTQIGTYEALATMQGLSLAGLPTVLSERHAALKGLLGL